MSDIAHEETEAIIKALEKRITAEYRQAEKEIQEKLDDYFKRFEQKDKVWRRWVTDGERTQEEYIQWRVGQMAIGQRWEEQKETIARQLTNATELAKSIAYGKMPDVYAVNFNYSTYDVEHQSLIDTSFTLIDPNVAAEILKDQQLYPDPGVETVKRIAEGLEMKWNKEQIQSVMLQGILQGESIGKMATRLSKTVGEKDRRASIRNARTMATGIQNKARVDGYNRALNMGINLKKQWLATLDGRTRHEHRLLDGQIQDVNKPFKVDGYDIRYPGDPEAPGYLLYNCRCTLISAIQGHEHDLSDLSERNTNKLGRMSYKEWKEAKAISQDILHQDKVAATMKGVYIAKYKGYIDW